MCFLGAAVDRAKCVPWVGRNLLAALDSHHRTARPTAEFLDLWRDALPEAWRDDAQLAAIQVRHSPGIRQRPTCSLVPPGRLHFTLGPHDRPQRRGSSTVDIRKAGHKQRTAEVARKIQRVEEQVGLAKLYLLSQRCACYHSIPAAAAATKTAACDCSLRSDLQIATARKALVHTFRNACSCMRGATLVFCRGR